MPIPLIPNSLFFFLLQTISKMSLPKVTVNDSKIGSLEGFLHNLSPTKDNRFEDGLQPKRKTHRVACFAPAKQPLFEDKNKSPLKISNFQYSKKGRDILINNNVQVEAVDRLDFPCAEIYGDNIKTKNNECCANFQMINVQGKIMQLRETRYVSTINLNCREASLVDETGTIKLTLWAEFCSIVENGLTYMFKNLCVNHDSYGRIYVNTPKQGCQIMLTDPISVNVNSSDIPSDEITIEKDAILSIDSISRYLDCSKCNAKIKPDTKSFADCPSCKIKQKVKACKPNMMVRVTIENQSDMKTHIVTMFKSQNLTVLPNAEQMMDDSLSEALLLLPETKVIYERQ